MDFRWVAPFQSHNAPKASGIENRGRFRTLTSVKLMGGLGEISESILRVQARRTKPVTYFWRGSQRHESKFLPDTKCWHDAAFPSRQTNDLKSQWRNYRYRFCIPRNARGKGLTTQRGNLPALPLGEKNRRAAAQIIYLDTGLCTLSTNGTSVAFSKNPENKSSQISVILDTKNGSLIFIY